jgi:phenylalanyl-tRNA synthetase beta chain
VRDILERLGLAPQTAGETWTVRIPSERATKDLGAEHDLIEEVGRIHRYGRIAEQPLSGELTPVARDARQALVRRIEDRLAGGARFHQTISYSFIGDELLEQLGLSELPHVQVINAVAEGFSRIRRRVGPSLLSSVLENRRRRSDVRLFEIGKGYLPELPNETGEPRELHELALLWARPKSTSTAWNDDLLLHLQGVLEDLLAHVGVEPSSASVAPVREDSILPAWANRGRAKCLGGLGWLAQLDPLCQRKLELVGDCASDVCVAVLSIDALLEAPRKPAAFVALPRFPGTKVDVALSLPLEKTAAEGVAAIERAGKGLVAQTSLFDIYQGPNLAAGRRSLAWHVLLQAPERTLNEEDGQKFLTRLRREIETLGGELRSE